MKSFSDKLLSVNCFFNNIVFKILEFLIHIFQKFSVENIFPDEIVNKCGIDFQLGNSKQRLNA